MLTDFHNSFHRQTWQWIYSKVIIKIQSPLKSVATLPCEMFVLKNVHAPELSCRLAYLRRCRDVTAERGRQFKKVDRVLPFTQLCTMMLSLYLTLSDTSSQCSSVCSSRDKLRSYFWVPLTTQAAALSTRCRVCVRRRLIFHKVV